MFCLAGTVTLFDASQKFRNQFIEQSATVSAVRFLTGSFVVYTGLEPFRAEQPFCVLLLAFTIQGHQRRERGREKMKRQGAYSMTMLLSHFYVFPVLYSWFPPLSIVHSQLLPLF